jgi:hypothetical protein
MISGSGHGRRGGRREDEREKSSGKPTMRLKKRGN